MHVGLEVMLAVKISGTGFVCIGQGPRYRVPAVTPAGGLGDSVSIEDLVGFFEHTADESHSPRMSSLNTLPTSHDHLYPTDYGWESYQTTPVWRHGQIPTRTHDRPANQAFEHILGIE